MFKIKGSNEPGSQIDALIEPSPTWEAAEITMKGVILPLIGG
jgi:hypothetical protein